MDCLFEHAFCTLDSIHVVGDSGHPRAQSCVDCDGFGETLCWWYSSKRLHILPMSFLIVIAWYTLILTDCILIEAFKYLDISVIFSSEHFSVLPRDAMHPRYLPWPCVSPSITSRSSTKTAERIELGFGMWASFHPFYTVLKGNSVISKIRALPSGTLS